MAYSKCRVPTGRRENDLFGGLRLLLDLFNLLGLASLVTKKIGEGGSKSTKKVGVPFPCFSNGFVPGGKEKEGLWGGGVIKPYGICNKGSNRDTNKNHTRYIRSHLHFTTRYKFPHHPVGV